MHHWTATAAGWKELGMIKVRIGKVEREADIPTDFDQSWIARELAHSGSKDSVCVAVSIDTSNAKMLLETDACPPGRGGREMVEDERRIYDLWTRLGLEGSKVTQVKLVGFLQQLRQLI